jgi:hypothetical protein
MKTLNVKKEMQTMIGRSMMWVLALSLAACDASLNPVVETSSPYGPYNSRMAPTLWITYPTEGATTVCLTANAIAEFPLHYTTYNAPAGSGVQFKLDPHVAGAAGNVRICGCGTATTGPCVFGEPASRCVWPSGAGQFIAVSMAGLTVGAHKVEGEIVQASGAALAGLPSDPAIQCLDATLCNKESNAHRYFVNFSTRARGTTASCPLPDGGT